MRIILLNRGRMTLSIACFRRINMVMFNAFWYMLLLVAGNVLPTQLVWLVPTYAIAHLIITPYGSFERVFALSCFSVGIAAEYFSQVFGCVHYRDVGVIAGIPLWILMMWLNFAISLPHAWWPWLRKWWIGLIVGLMAATFPYFGAQKAGILTVNMPLALGVFWSIYGVVISYALNVMFAKLSNLKTKE